MNELSGAPLTYSFWVSPRRVQDWYFSSWAHHSNSTTTIYPLLYKHYMILVKYLKLSVSLVLKGGHKTLFCREAGRITGDNLHETYNTKGLGGSLLSFTC